MVNEIIDGKYQIISKIGSGGTSVVYKAVRLADGRIVAIKIVRDGFENNKENERHFYLEAEALYKMSHRNIRRILGIGQWNESLYMVTEYIDGNTLKDLISSGNISMKEAVDYALQIAAGIEHAHRKDIIHRDIKPQNVIVSKDGTVKIVDFGIARMTSQTTRTMAGKDVVGSVHYISPEQAKGVQVDHRCDIYSFGILLYELFTGKVPFEGTEAVSIAMRHVNQIPEPPQSINPKLTSGLNDIIVKCIQKDPSQRYQSASELREDLLLYVANPEGFSVIKADALQGREKIEEIPAKTENIKIRQHVVKNEKDSLHPRRENDNNEDNKKTTSNNGIKKFLIIVGACVLLTALLLFILSLIPDKNTETTEYEKAIVPNIYGKTKDEAITLLKESKFMRMEFPTEESNVYSANHVIRTEPAIGNDVSLNTIIKVYISKGPKHVEVENVIGKTETEAREILTSSGLTVEVVYVEDDLKIENTVISQSNKTNTVKYGDTITIEVAKKRALLKLVVPDLSGAKSIEEAKKIITDAGFSVGNITEKSVSDASLGGVSEQKPQADVEYSYAYNEEPPVIQIDFNINIVKKIYNFTYEFETPEGDNKNFTLIIYNSNDDTVEECDYIGTNKVVREVEIIEGESYRFELYVDNQLVDKKTFYAGN